MQPRTRKAGSGMAVYDPSTENMALMYSRVPGRQTVPRAELWALYNIMLKLAPNTTYTLYIDARDVLTGLWARSKHYSAGNNGDLWSRIYDILDKRVDGDIFLLK